VLDASRALQAGNAARFLGYFDAKETPRFAELRAHVLALVETKDIATSVQVDRTTFEGDVATLSVDWLLQLTPAHGLGAVERRRREVLVRVRTSGKPKIISLDPVELFGPQPPGEGP
jgi:hypothetical protein